MSRIPTEEYRELCKNYFRPMYAAQWSASSTEDVPGCEDMCKQIRENPDSEIGIAYNGYVLYRNSGVDFSATQQPVQKSEPNLQLTNEPQGKTHKTKKCAAQLESAGSPAHTPDQYTSKDGLMADERLLASQNHTIIMLLSDIAETLHSLEAKIGTTESVPE